MFAAFRNSSSLPADSSDGDVLSEPDAPPMKRQSSRLPAPAVSAAEQQERDQQRDHDLDRLHEGPFMHRCLPCLLACARSATLAVFRLPHLSWLLSS